MKRTDFGDMPCPIAQALERVGEWWSILILRDALAGYSRFDDFQRSLGIAPNTLSRRLSALVEAGLLERHQYSERPPRDEYRLTASGRDFLPVLWTLMEWSNKHFAPDGPAVRLVDRQSKEEVTPLLIDGKTGLPLTPQRHEVVAGPAAPPGLHQRLAELKERKRRANDTTPDPVSKKPASRRKSK